MENAAKIIMIFFSGYEIYKLLNFEKVFRSVSAAMLALRISKKDGSPGKTASGSTLDAAHLTPFGEMGWMIHLELVYPFAMIFLLFTRFYWVGLIILLASVAFFLLLMGRKTEKTDENAKGDRRNNFLKIGLILSSVLAILLMLYAVFFAQ
jgi:hypothetical protein